MRIVIVYHTRGALSKSLVFLAFRWYSLINGGEGRVKRRVLLIAPGGFSLEDLGEEGYGAITIEVKPIKGVPSVVEDAYGLAQMLSKILGVLQNISKIYDAIVISCFEDLGVDLPKRLGIPVIGLGDVSVISGALHGRRFSILVPNRYLASLLYRRILEKGLAPSLASIRVVSPSDQDIFSALLLESQKAIEEDGAQAIVLGYPAWRKFSDALRGRMSVPVIEPLSTALNLLEAILARKGKENA